MNDETTTTPAGKCPQCGEQMPPKHGPGRRPIYCSGACRKASFEARRDRTPGAYEVRVIERVETVDHDLNECVRRVLASPTACKNVLSGMAKQAADGSVGSDPKWQAARSALDGLLYALHGPYRIERPRR